MVVVVIAAAFAPLFGGVVEVDLSFSAGDFALLREGDFVRVVSAECVPWGEVGSPEVLAKALNVLLPPGAAVESVSVEGESYGVLADGVVLAPHAPPVIRPTPAFAQKPPQVEPNPEVYSRDEWLPEESVLLCGGGSLAGYSLAGVLVFPIRYNPTRGVVEYLRGARLRVWYRDGAAQGPEVRSPRGEALWRRVVLRTVANPELLKLYDGLWTVDPGVRDYAVFAPMSLASSGAMASFRLSLRRQGWNDTLVFLEDLGGSPGADFAERLRLALSDFFHSGGAAAVVVGDDGAAPIRHAFAMDCGAGFTPDENDIPCDLYFSALDGNWNADGDTAFGEVTDSVDLYPDIIFGRISVGDAGEFGAWVEKYLAYVCDPPADFGGEALLLGEVLWEDPFTDAGIGKDIVASRAFPTCLEVTRLYETLGNENLASVTDAFNEGYAVVNHDGHAFYSVLGVGGEYFTIDDADALFNFPRCGIMYSIGCWPAAFDYDCIAEHFISNPSGGFVAFVGNSRYGWGSPGNPGYGYSDYFDRAFWEEIFGGVASLGAALAAVKARFAPFAKWENVWRWNEYEINVLGEPGMVVWQCEPEAASYELPRSVRSRGAAVSVASPGEVSVSALQGGELLTRGVGRGRVELWLEAEPGLPLEISILSCDGKARLFVDTIEVVGDGPCLTLGAPFVGSVVAPGETVDVSFPLENCGEEPCEVRCLPSVELGGFVVDFDSSAVVIEPDSQRTLSATIGVNGDMAFGDLVIGRLGCVCGGDTIPLSFSIAVDAPRLSVKELRLWGTHSGDAARAGESYTLFALISKPEGSHDISGTVRISSPSDFLDVDTTLDFGFSGSDTATAGGARLVVSSFCPEPAALPVTFSFNNGDVDTFWLSVGGGAFFDDCESDPAFSGSGEWRQTSDDFRSASHSYRCAGASGTYGDGDDDLLVSEPFVVGEDAELSFWMRYELPTLEFDYGCDGLYIYVCDLDADTVIQLDYIGGGGALPLLGFEVGWSEWRYKLPVRPGTTVQIEFRFVSDFGDAAEGFFIDDIGVFWQPTVVESVHTGVDEVSAPKRLSLSVFPNPFNGACRISVEGAEAVLVLDLSGRVVERIDPAGGEAVWLPKGAQSGVYLIVAQTKDARVAKKVYLLR